MPKLILLIALFACIWYGWIYQNKLTQKKRLTFFWKSGFWLLLVIAIYLVVTGRMHWLGAGIAALVPFLRTVLVWGSRAVPLLRLLGRFKTAPSQFRTQFLSVTINFSKGQVFGEVLSGDFSGIQLVDLSKEQLDTLSRQYKIEDKETYILLQAYRIRSGTSKDQSSDQYRPENTTVSVAEAYEILGLPTTASREEIIKTHKRLIQRLHPDRGGSDFLAAKINAAKDQLIK